MEKRVTTKKSEKSEGVKKMNNRKMYQVKISTQNMGTALYLSAEDEADCRNRVLKNGVKDHNGKKMFDVKEDEITSIEEIK